MKIVSCTYPRRNANGHGNPSKRWAATASAQHSIKHGAKASRNTVNDSFFKALGSNPRPARISITVKAIALKI